MTVLRRGTPHCEFLKKLGNRLAANRHVLMMVLMTTPRDWQALS